ncbi:MAG: hypothetical protein RIC55_23540 [Pirellulaceae bacterium]
MSYPSHDPNNPYAQAYGFNYGGPGHDPSAVIRLPAVGLVIVSSFWMLILVVMLVLNLFQLITGADLNIEQGQDMLGEAAMPLNLVGIMLQAGVNSCVLYGSLGMVQRRNYGVAVTASVLAVIPCFSPCFFLGIPLGLWALFLLFRPEVKYGFR